MRRLREILQNNGHFLFGANEPAARMSKILSKISRADTIPDLIYQICVLNHAQENWSKAIQYCRLDNEVSEFGRWLLKLLHATQIFFKPQSELEKKLIRAKKKRPALHSHYCRSTMTLYVAIILSSTSLKPNHSGSQQMVEREPSGFATPPHNISNNNEHRSKVLVNDVGSYAGCQK